MEIIIISGAPQTEFTARCCISIEKGAIGDKNCPKLSRKVWFGQKSCKKANNVTNWNRRDRKGIFQMKDIKEIVTRLSGHRNRACYPVLCCAAEVMKKYQPHEPQMKIILAEAKLLMRDGKERKEGSLSKALSRALDDIWENGDRKELEKVFGRKVIERPTPRELVCQIAEYAWDPETAA